MLQKVLTKSSGLQLVRYSSHERSGRSGTQGVAVNSLKRSGTGRKGKTTRESCAGNSAKESSSEQMMVHMFHCADPCRPAHRNVYGSCPSHLFLTGQLETQRHRGTFPEYLARNGELEAGVPVAEFPPRGSAHGTDLWAFFCWSIRNQQMNAINPRTLL